MEERATALGGTLTIDSAPGEGTTISLEVPLGGENSRPGG
jgi:signal transduction histidine kinase